MREHDLRKLVEGTKDVAYVADASGRIAAWNENAELFFGIKAADAIGRLCHGVLGGSDQIGPVCSHDCMVRQALHRGIPLENFDMQVRTAVGKQWCNFTVMMSENASTGARYAVHIVRPIDAAKRLEMAVRDYLLTHTELTDAQCTRLLAATTPATQPDLTARELEVLRMLASGASTKRTAAELHISSTTVKNHIRHILRKLDSHTRLEAIRRAERSGLV